MYTCVHVQALTHIHVHTGARTDTRKPVETAQLRLGSRSPPSALFMPLSMNL